MRSRKPAPSTAAGRARAPRRPREVFLSRAEEEPAGIDRSIRSVVETLGQHRIAVWTAPAKIRAAQHWHDQIGQALARCDWFMLALTRRSVTRPWVKRELLFALNDERYHERILPLVFEDCAIERLSWVLRGSTQIVDFTSNAERAHRALLATWGLA